jgi:hypothetical protein
MNVKREILALAVRILAEKTNLIQKPDPSTEFFNTIFGAGTYDQRMAENLEVGIDKTTELVKRARLNREFNKIVRNV